MVVEMLCLMMAVQKRTKKEIMEEVIAKSKYFKASFFGQMRCWFWSSTQLFTLCLRVYCIYISFIDEGKCSEFVYLS